jgi:hypothetical protein
MTLYYEVNAESVAVKESTNEECSALIMSEVHELVS